MADISKIKPLGSDTTYDIKDNSAVANITRNGTTFTATRRDGTTFTFTQQDNNTDTKVNVVARGTTKAYLLADTTAPTSTAAAHTAVAETGVYLDTTAATLVATTFKGDLTGNADTATKLSTARNINGIAFDGSANINTPFYYDAKISQGSTTAGWYKFADYTDTSSGHTIKITYFIQRGWNKEQCGILEFDITLGSSGWSNPSLKWLIRTPAMPVDCIGCVVNDTTVTLYGYMDQTNPYGAMTITEIWKGNQGGERQHTSFTYYNSSTITTPTPTFTTQSSDNGIVDQANKATQDSDGNAINTTYIKKSIGTTAGDIIYWSAASTPTRLGIGSNGQVLKVVNDVPAWSSDNNSVTGVKGNAESSYRTGNVNITSANIGLGNVTNHQQVHEVAWDSTNKKITRSKNGTAGDVVQFVAGSNVTLTAESGKLTIASSYTNSRDPGYGKITPTGDTGTSAVTANTTQITAKSYNEGFTFKTGNKWLTVAGTESATAGSDILTIGHKAGLTAKSSYGSTATTASADGGTIKVTDVQYDEAGHITASTDRTITLSQVKNTAGSTDTSSKIYLIGATSQAANPQTYSDNEVFVTDGTLSTKNISVSGTATLSGETTADGLTVGNLQVNGSANFVNSPTAPTPAAASNDTSVATTAYVTSAINALDGTVSGTPGVGKTLTVFSQTDGKVSATFANISITKSQISDFPTSMTPASHTHGNITNDGKLGTASVAVVTGSDNKITTEDLSVSDPTASGTDITYIATISQNGKGKITVTKSTVRTGTTSQTGVLQLTDSTSSTSTTTAATPNSVKSAYDLANNHKYWANVEATSAAAYNKTPEVAKVKINGNTSATAASTKNVELVYDSTLEVLNFVFS